MKTERIRAGLFRRGFSLFIDIVVVSIPFQILTAILFATTAGQVQFNHGLTYTRCFNVTNLPADLKPAPPANANTAQACKISFFGAEIARQLTVARVSQSGNTTSGVAQTYMLDAHNKTINGWTLDWPAFIALIAYLIWAPLRDGGTIGDRTTKIVLVDDSPNTTSPPSPQQMGVRTLVQFGPFAVAVLGESLLVSMSGNSANQIASIGFWIWLAALAAPVTLFYLVCVVQIALKRDPLWDRAARTAMLVKAAAASDADSTKAAIASPPS